MIVLVDTPIWSLALRRQTGQLSGLERQLTQSLAELIREGRARILGPIRQELLSGIREESQFLKLRNSLRAFDESPLEIEDYEEAARISNQCRRHGIAGSAIDLLICSAAYRRGWEIFSSDRDFRNYAAVVAVRLYSGA